MLLLSSMISPNLQRYVCIPLVAPNYPSDPCGMPSVSRSFAMSRYEAGLRPWPRTTCERGITRGLPLGSCLRSPDLDLSDHGRHLALGTMTSFRWDAVLPDRNDQALLILYTSSNPLPNLSEINDSLHGPAPYPLSSQYHPNFRRSHSNSKLIIRHHSKKRKHGSGN